VKPRTLAIGGVLSIVIGACSSTPSPAPMATPELVLLLASPAGGPELCMDALMTGDLVLHPEAGMAIVSDPARPPMPVQWPSGYVGRRLGTEIEVLGRDGAVVAVTGTQVTFGGGASPPGTWSTCAGIRG
jgi:hypothetical protein